ncbi:hypothetical protein T02_14467, partial [Trichinella nativa]
LERVWFDYCSVHVSTVISHVSQQFRFLVFLIVAVRMNFMHFVIARVVSVKWKYFYKLKYLSLMVVQIRNHVDNHKALLPVDAAQFGDVSPGVASGYAPGQIKICIFPQAMPQANGLHHQHRARSYSCVGVKTLPSIGPEICVGSLITGMRYTNNDCNSSIYREYSRRALVFGYIIQVWKCVLPSVRLIRNHVDKYVITKHYQLMPLSLATNGLHHQHPARLYSCVSLGWLNGVTQYWSRNLCGFAYHRRTIRNHVDKYVITKHYYQLMPTVNKSLKRQGSY